MPFGSPFLPVVGSASERNVALTLVVSARLVVQVTSVLTGAGKTVPCAVSGMSSAASTRTNRARTTYSMIRIPVEVPEPLGGPFCYPPPSWCHCDTVQVEICKPL